MSQPDTSAVFAEFDTDGDKQVGSSPCLLRCIHRLLLHLLNLNILQLLLLLAWTATNAIYRLRAFFPCHICMLTLYIVYM